MEFTGTEFDREAAMRSLAIGIMLESIHPGQWVWEKVKHMKGWRFEVFTMLNDFRWDFRDRDWELPDREYWHQYVQE